MKGKGDIDMSKKIMKAEDFAKKAKTIAKGYKTAYWWGCLGFRCTEESYRIMCRTYPDWYHRNKSTLKIGKAIWGTDCVGLIKLLLWGFDPVKTDVSRGGAKYASNGVGDMNETTMISKCSGVSSKFNNIKVGEVVWLPGHIGIYVGDNLVVECTPRWRNGVQFSGLGNIGGRNGYNTRSWVKHGKLPWIDYSSAKSGIYDKVYSTKVVSKYLRVPDINIMYGDTGSDVKELQTCHNKMVGLKQIKDELLVIDGSFGDLTKKACKVMQKYFKHKKWYKGKVDGICGPKTRAAMVKWYRKFI